MPCSRACRAAACAPPCSKPASACRPGKTWGPTGVLEHRTDGTPGLPADWHTGPGADWTIPAPESAREQAGLPPEAVACWHTRAGWIRPPQLARALLREPGVTWRGQCAVASLRPMPGADAAAPTEWQALDAQGQVLAQAPVVVIAAGAGSPTLLAERWPLQPVRGQVSWGRYAAHLPPPAPFPANGHGNVVPSFGVGQTDNPAEQATERGWIMGSTFERNVTELPASAPDQLAAHQGQWSKLQTLMPTAAQRPGAPFRSPAGGWRAGRWRGRPGGTLGCRALHRPRPPAHRGAGGCCHAARPVGVHRHGCAGADSGPAVRRIAGRPPERRTPAAGRQTGPSTGE